MRKPPSRRSFRCCLLLAPALAGVGQAQQAGPSGSTPAAHLPDFGRPAGSIYLLGSTTNHEFHFAREIGYSTGGTLELSPHFALTDEWSMEHWHGPLHTYLALAGPRLAWPAGRYVPFAALMGGVGHAGTAGPNHLLPPGVTPSYYGIAGSVTLGLEVRLTDRLSWRMDAGAARIHTVPVNQPCTGSTGLVYRLFQADLKN